MLSLSQALRYAASDGEKERMELAGENCHGEAALKSSVVAFPNPSFKLYGAGWTGRTAAYM